MYTKLAYFNAIFSINKCVSLADVIIVVWATDESEYLSFTLRVLIHLEVNMSRSGEG